MLIIQWTRMKTNCDAMYYQPLEQSSSYDEDNNNKKNKKGVDNASIRLSVIEKISAGGVQECGRWRTDEEKKKED